MPFANTELAHAERRRTRGAKLAVYVSLQNDDCIRHFEMDEESGRIEFKSECAAPGGPAPMCLSADGRTIHAGFRGYRPDDSPGSSGDVLPEHGLGSFAIDARSGELRATGRVYTQGEPCFLRTDRSSRFLLSSYFQAGRVASHRVDTEGGVSGEPIEWLATNSGAHSVQLDPTNRFAFVPHIGKGNGGLTRLPPERSHPANAIFQFRFDERTGRLTPNDPPRVGPGVERQWGPRHSCWHPTQPWLYVVNEQGNNASRYTLDRERGTLKLEETITTLPPEGHPSKTSTADIQIHPSGRFLYAPNRGHDSIATFRVDQQTGRLASVGWARADAQPRAFMLDPTGQFLVCAGVKTGRLTTYRIEPQDGTLTEQDSVVCGRVPMWVLITGPANSRTSA